MKMKKRPRAHDVLERMIPVALVWALGKVLNHPNVKRKLEEFDELAHEKKVDAYCSAKRAGSNAMANKAWLAAGLGALAVGATLIGKATRR